MSRNSSSTMGYWKHKAKHSVTTTSSLARVSTASLFGSRGGDNSRKISAPFTFKTMWLRFCRMFSRCPRERLCKQVREEWKWLAFCQFWIIPWASVLCLLRIQNFPNFPWDQVEVTVHEYFIQWNISHYYHQKYVFILPIACFSPLVLWPKDHKVFQPISQWLQLCKFLFSSPKGIIAQLTSNFPFP